MIRRAGVLAACLGILVSACSTLNDGGVTTNFGDEIAQQQNLVFTFEDEMVPDSLANKWDESGSEYVRLRPSVAGRFKWLSTKQLMFSPGTGFKPATDYTAEITDAVTKQLSGADMPKTKMFSFHTAYINIVNTASQWTRNSTTGSTEVRVVLGFNYAVKSSDVAKRLHVMRDGAELPYAIQNPESTGEVVLTIPGTALNTDEAVTLTARVDAGVVLESGTRASDVITTSVQVPSRRSLNIVDAVAEWQDLQGVVRVSTTQSIDEQTLMQSITFSPAIAFTATITQSGFDIHASFEVGQTYELTLAKTLRGTIGGELSAAYSKEILFGDLAPTIEFVSKKGMYLASKGSRALAMRIVNTPRVRISVFRIYENNLLHAVRQARSYGYWDDEGQSGTTYEFRYLGLDAFADTVMTQEVETSTLGAMEKGIVAFTLDVSEHTTRKGLYIVSVQSTEDEWRRATKLVSLSDIGLIAKEGPDKLTVFANSIGTAEPMAGVELSLISTNNQLISTIRTNGDGVAELEKLREAYGNFKLGMITAQHGEDYTVLITQDTRVDQSRFDVGGVRDNSSGLQAFIYGDRDIYRPGETIHLNTIVRDKAWKPFVNTPFKLRITMPNGKELRTVRVTPNEQGAAAAEVLLSSNALTGTYHIEAVTATDVIIGSYNVAVEEFLPDRVKLNVNASVDVVKPTVPFDVTVNAMSFFGTPSAGRKYDITMRLRSKTFVAKKYPDFDFAIKADNAADHSNLSRTGTLDAQGNATESFTIDSTARNSGLLDASFFITVFDEGGRPVHRNVTRPVQTQPILMGIKKFDRYVALRSPLRIPLLATNYDGVATSGRAHVQVVKTEWHTVMENNYSSYRYVSQKRELMLMDKDMDVSGTNYSFGFTPSTSGEYAVRVFMPGGKSYVEREFWAYGWSDNSASSFEVNTEGLIDIELDKEVYQPGEIAKVLFKTPFAGSLIVTVERDGVIEHRTLKTDKRSASMDLKVQDAFAPNVFIAATLIKPHAKSDMPLTVAHGYQPLIVERPKSVLPVSITAAASSRSQRKQTITVKTEAGAQVTVAVVDEGILQIRSTETPDPHGFFYRKRALQVDAFDMYPYLFPELRMLRAASGAGDDGMDRGMGNRLNPFAAKRATLVSYWSGIVAASNGTATVSVDLPQGFSGAVRVMAVAWKNASFGSAEKTMTVADPIVISTGLPRVFAPGDSVSVPVMLTNTTGQRANITARLITNGPVYIAGADKQSVVVEANSERAVMYTVIAKNELGVATVKAEVTGMGETFAQSTEISVRPSTPLAEESGYDVVKAGASKDITLKTSFIPRTTSSRLIVSTFPAAQFSKNLGQLLGYPYGCIEQTVSKAFPQIYFADLVKAWNAKLKRVEDPSRNVQEAIRKIESMQSYNGGVSYWPGGTEVTWWGTIYAAHFMSEAKRAGYEVNSKSHSRMLDYVAKRTRGRSTENVHYYGGDAVAMRTYAARDIFYSLYLLAIEGRQDVPTMNYYKGQTSMMSQDSRYMLACTYLALGDRKSYEALLPSSFNMERYRPMDGGSFASPVRDLGFALYALVSTAPDNPQTAKLAQRLASTMNDNDVYSTQENAFALIALGKLANRAMKSGATATITANGKTIAKMDGTTATVSDPLGKTIKITASNGPVYYFWSVEGVRSDGGFKQEDVVLKIRRDFLDRNGHPLSALRVQQNELVVIKVTIATTDRSTVDNVVISDVLPAGFELENPRLTGMDNAAWAKDESTAEYYDYRDDRMNLFVRAEPKTKTYYYMVRAVSKGRFRMGPIGADAMYDDDVHSYHGAGTLVVL